MAKQFIKDLNERDSVDDVFLVTDKSVMRDKNGKLYMSFNVQDKTGTINVRVWENVDKIQDTFQEGDFVKVKGHVQVYQKRKQVVGIDILPVDPKHCEMSDFISGSKKPAKQTFAELQDFIGSIEDPNIKHVLNWTFNQNGFEPKFLKTPAAKSIHHAYMGGLMDHIVSICHTMDHLARHYTQLNRDLLLFGAIFHDIGKVDELEIGKGISYTDQGRLVGHMNIACEYIDNSIRAKEDFPAELKNVLKHIVLSHHGKLEYGSPKRPKFPEALVVAMIDELDSRLDTLFSFLSAESDSDEEWTRYHPDFDRYFYLKYFKQKLEE